MQRTRTFANRLKEYRETNKITLAEMEEITNVPAQTLNRYELEQRIPKIDTAIEISEALKINPLWLFGYDVSIEKEEEPIALHESQLLSKYREKETMQPAVNRLLEFEPTNTPVYSANIAAHGGNGIGYVENTAEQDKLSREERKKLKFPTKGGI